MGEGGAGDRGSHKALLSIGRNCALNQILAGFPCKIQITRSYYTEPEEGGLTGQWLLPSCIATHKGSIHFDFPRSQKESGGVRSGQVLLVVKDDIRSPDVVTGHVELFHPAVLLRVPLQLVVPPELLHPQVGRHDLVLQVLKNIGLRRESWHPHCK